MCLLQSLACTRPPSVKNGVSKHMMWAEVRQMAVLWGRPQRAEGAVWGCGLCLESLEKDTWRFPSMLLGRCCLTGSQGDDRHCLAGDLAGLSPMWSPKGLAVTPRAGEDLVLACFLRLIGEGCTGVPTKVCHSDCRCCGSCIQHMPAGSAGWRAQLWLPQMDSVPPCPFHI